MGKYCLIPTTYQSFLNEKYVVISCGKCAGYQNRMYVGVHLCLVELQLLHSLELSKHTLHPRGRGGVSRLVSWVVEVVAKYRCQW